MQEVETIKKGGMFFCEVNNRKVPVLVRKKIGESFYIKNLTNNRNLVVKDRDRFLEPVPGGKAGAVLVDYTSMVLRMAHQKEIRRLKATLLHCLKALIEDDKTVAGLTVAGLIKRLGKL